MKGTFECAKGTLVKQCRCCALRIAAGNILNSRGVWGGAVSPCSGDSGAEPPENFLDIGLFRS